MKNVIILLTCVVGFNFLGGEEVVKKEEKVVNCKVIDLVSYEIECK